MKILLVTDTCNVIGGAENYFFDLHERLQNIPDISVQILSFGSHAITHDNRTIFKASDSHFAKLLGRFLFYPFLYFKLRKYLRQLAPDVIHLHNIKQCSLTLLYALRSYKVVQTIHDYSAVCPVGYNIHRNLLPCPTGWRLRCFWQHQVKYSKWIYFFVLLSFLNVRRLQQNIVCKFFAPSPQLVHYLQQNRFKPAIYIPPFKKEDASPSFEEIDPHLFMYAGNLGTHKGIYFLLNEFARAHTRNAKIKLIIAGEGPEKKALIARAQQLKLTEAVQFCGWQESLAPLYKRAIAVLFPSLWLEAFGLIMTEAMHHARPVIGSNRGSPPWIIDDRETGFIFNPLRPGDLAEKILTLADNLPLAKKLGLNGRQKLSTFINNEATLSKILNEYRGVMGKTVIPAQAGIQKTV